MATLTLATNRLLVRGALNETSTARLANAEIDMIANDGYKDTAVKGLCYESKIAKNNIAASEKIISLAGSNVIRVNYVEYLTGTTEGGAGIPCIYPNPVGTVTADLVSAANGTGTPQYWFQWGDYLVIEPIPDVATYDLAVYAACYPAAIMSADSDTPASLPVEFHECVYLYTVAFCCLKLKRWSDFASFYNRYIIEVQRRRAEYITKYPDRREVRLLYDNVTMEQK